jgi:hypothetical protein
MTTSLREWVKSNVPDDAMYWKGAFGDQISAVKSLARLFTTGLPFVAPDDFVQVISSHFSKSIDLPVYELSRPDLGLRIILRDNFYNWKISVISEAPIEADFAGLFYTAPPADPEYTGDPLRAVYCEGFPDSLVFGYYDASDRRQFSAELYSNHALYTAVFLILRALGAVKPLVFSTRGGTSERTQP